MRSLRAQVLALVVAAVLVTLLVFAYFGTRTADVQFRAIIASSRISSGDSMVVALDSTVLSRGPGPLRWTARGDSSSRQHVEIARRLLREGGADSTVIVRLTPGESLRGTRALDSALAHLPEVERAARRFSLGFSRAMWLGIPALLGVAALLALLVTGRMLGPIGRLTTAARGIAAGDYATRVGATQVTELGGLAEAFDRMAEGLERSESSRRQVMRDLAHELRTPLTNLKAQIEALQDGLRPADVAALASLHEEASVLERLVGDVDVLARADAGRLEMHVEPFPLAAVVTAAVDGFVHAGRLAPHRVMVQVGQDLVVRADRQRVGQVLRNLIDNALRHGGPDVRVRVAAVAHGTQCLLRVSDSGAGIPPEHVARVFDRLYRVDPSRARATGGAGLGLSIVKALLEAQEGSVRLVSTGQGTTVECALPRAASA